MSDERRTRFFGAWVSETTSAGHIWAWGIVGEGEREPSACSVAAVDEEEAVSAGEGAREDFSPLRSQRTVLRFLLRLSSELSEVTSATMQGTNRMGPSPEFSGWTSFDAVLSGSIDEGRTDRTVEPSLEPSAIC